jgi:hypothetical protein
MAGGQGLPVQALFRLLSFLGPLLHGKFKRGGSVRAGGVIRGANPACRETRVIQSAAGEHIWRGVLGRETMPAWHRKYRRGFCELQGHNKIIEETKTKKLTKRWHLI